LIDYTNAEMTLHYVILVLQFRAQVGKMVHQFIM